MIFKFCITRVIENVFFGVGLILLDIDSSLLSWVISDFHFQCYVCFLVWIRRDLFIHSTVSWVVPSFNDCEQHCYKHQCTCFLVNISRHFCCVHRCPKNQVYHSCLKVFANSYIEIIFIHWFIFSCWWLVIFPWLLYI